MPANMDEAPGHFKPFPRLADDRWPQARQRLDFDHAGQPLVAVGRAR